MSDLTLLNTQKQQIFDLIKKAGLDPFHFEWGVEPIYRAGQLQHRYSIIRSKLKPDFSFTFPPGMAGAYNPISSPGRGQRKSALGNLPWEGCLIPVQQWALMVEQELKTPAPWAALPKLATTADLVVSPATVNTPFSYRDVEQIRSGLAEIRDLFLNTSRHSAENDAIIRTQLEGLEKASQQMGRRDWVNLAIGTVITLALQVAAPPETVKAAFEILKRILVGMVDLLPSVLATGQHLL